MFDDSSYSGLTEFLLIVIIVGIIILPLIFFLLTLRKALKRCSPECRTITPNSVWLMLIPIYSIFWQFGLVSHIEESLHNEFTKRHITENPEPGKSIGIASCVLNVSTIIPVIGILTAWAAIICWIIYWVKISQYSYKLERTEIS